MAKKIRFPLNLAEGKQARDLTELREFFSLPEVLGYVADGKLVIWLNDRYETHLAEQISTLDATDPDFEEKICKVLEVEFHDNSITLEDAQARNEKLAKLKEFTDDKAIWPEVDCVAFDQEDVYDLLDEDFTKIYLCGETFTVPITKEGVTYIGVNKPIVVISSKEVVDFQAKNLVFEGVEFDEVYQSVVKLQREQTNHKEQERQRREEELQRREEELQRREEELQRREKEILQREEALELQQEVQLPPNHKITLNLSGTVLSYKEETMLLLKHLGKTCLLQSIFDEERPDYFGLEIYTSDFTKIDVLNYSFKNIDRCTKRWVLHDFEVFTRKKWGVSNFFSVKFLPKRPFPDCVLEKYHFIEY